VVKQYLEIHPDFRLNLKNVNNKTPKELMEDSFNNIQQKLKCYVEEIEQNKVTDLSVIQRKIEVKTRL
jgi:hypothetical protein